MQNGETDEEIISLYQSGEEGIFKILVERYTSSLFNYVARMVNKNDAADIVQEIFIKAWKNMHRFDPERASFKTWIFTIAKNSTTDFLRKKKNLLFSDLPASANGDNENMGNTFEENIPAEEVLPEVALQQLEDRAFLNETLKKLRPTYQEILILHYQEEMTFENIAEILGKPTNTIKSQHHRAILELRKIIK